MSRSPHNQGLRVRDGWGRFVDRRVRPLLAVVVLLACGFAGVTVADCCEASEPFQIRIVDRENKWPVPLVELRTTHHVRFVSDNAGLIAFDLPELMNVRTWLHVEGHGYSVPKDGFGYSGVRVVPRPGESVTIEVDRQLSGKRLGRITGGGLFAESQKLGKELEWTEQGILGCDSVQNAVHDGKLFWSWGDTTLPGYPLGRFHMIGATTAPRPLESFRPPIRLRYDYFVDCAACPSKHRRDAGTWTDLVIRIRQSPGRRRDRIIWSRLIPRSSHHSANTNAVSVFGMSAESSFEQHRVLWSRSDAASTPPPAPTGHAVFTVDANGDRWALFGDPFPSLRCQATFEAWSNSDNWETLQPQQAVPTLDASAEIKPHRGAIAWSPYRGKWVCIFTEIYGKPSALGEIWYAEADDPSGPWGGAIKVVTHNQYTFYNPQVHPEFSEPDSPILLFEATYTHTFSANKQPTPRHDYNQVLYRLDLDQLP